MELTAFGIDFNHAKGEFAKKIIPPHYTVCLFLTPFLYEKDGRLCEGNTGDILINTPGHIVYHGPRKDMKEGFRNDWFYISGSELGDLLKSYPLPLNTAFHLTDSSFFREYAKRIAFEFHERLVGNDKKIECIITEMLIDTHRKYTQSIGESKKLDGINAAHLAVIREPQREWKLADMARYGGYSTSRFSELFVERYGISPINFVLRTRIELAKKLLSSGQANVSRVAELCGFNTVNYFSKYFKSATGTTPSEYIKLN